jgi:prenyltransferase/squalene oxidase-like repeat protein
MVVYERQNVYAEVESESAPGRRPLDSLPLQGARQAIAAGLKFLAARHHGRRWSSARKGHDAGTTAYIAARLGELPPGSFGHPLRNKIEDSLDWLLEIQTSGGGWSSAPEEPTDDANSTAWAILALRQHGRTAPEPARAFLRRCRRPDGAFALRPQETNASGAVNGGQLLLTALAIRALGIVTSSSSDLLEESLRAGSRQLSQTEGLLVCSTILDWQASATPLSLLNEVQQSVRRLSARTALEQALLLRCLVRLRMREAWIVADELDRAQQTDGAWDWDGEALTSVVPAQSSFSGFEGRQVISATAVSALAMRNLQPGLYFGSDLPFRRLDEV